LPNKNYHHIHALICHERSLQKTLSNELKTEFKQKAEMHKKQYAALSIQGIWKNYKNHHTLNSKEYKKNFNI
jgi:hypothetical protein